MAITENIKRFDLPKLSMKLGKTLAVFSAAFSLGLAASYGQSATLRAGDIFELNLSGMPLEFSSEFHQSYTVGDDGSVSIPYIGAMKAGGITVTQFARNVERKLVADKIFTSPTVAIALQPSSRFVTIGGGVRAPSAIPWSPDLTLSAAIKRAGGTSDFGSMTKIRVTREGKVSVFNLKKADKGDQSQNPKLLPGDEVDVPE